MFPLSTQEALEQFDCVCRKLITSESVARLCAVVVACLNSSDRAVLLKTALCHVLYQDQ